MEPTSTEARKRSIPAAIELLAQFLAAGMIKNGVVTFPPSETPTEIPLASFVGLTAENLSGWEKKNDPKAKARAAAEKSVSELRAANMPGAAFAVAASFEEEYGEPLTPTSTSTSTEPEVPAGKDNN